MRINGGNRGETRSSALWGTGNRGGESRSNALWGKGGRGALTALAAMLAICVPLAASSPEKKKLELEQQPISSRCLEHGAKQIRTRWSR